MKHTLLRFSLEQQRQTTAKFSRPVEQCKLFPRIKPKEHSILPCNRKTTLIVTKKISHLKSSFLNSVHNQTMKKHEKRHQTSNSPPSTYFFVLALHVSPWAHTDARPYPASKQRNRLVYTRWCPVSSTVSYRIVLGYRVSLGCASRGTAVYDAAPWRYECLEFINGRRANDKSHVRFVSSRGPFYPREKGEERERLVLSHKGTSSFDELLPCTSRSRLADKSAPVFTRATRLQLETAREYEIGPSWKSSAVFLPLSFFSSVSSFTLYAWLLFGFVCFVANSRAPSRPRGGVADNWEGSWYSPTLLGLEKHYQMLV